MVLTFWGLDIAGWLPALSTLKNIAGDVMLILKMMQKNQLSIGERKKFIFLQRL